MAVGAQARDILRLVVREGMRPVGIGVMVGLIAAFVLSRLIEKLLFGVSATDPLTFLGVASTLTVVAFLACCIPARRASKLDPLVALRHD